MRQVYQTECRRMVGFVTREGGFRCERVRVEVYYCCETESVPIRVCYVETPEQGRQIVEGVFRRCGFEPESASS